LRIASAARGSMDRSTTRFLPPSHCWTPMKRRSTAYFDAARRAADFAIAEYFDAQGEDFFDRASGAAAHGGLEVHRKPLQ